MIPALLKWIGNKQRFAPLIVSAMPTSFNDYYEPFLGSGAVLAELKSSSNTGLFPTFNEAHAADILPFLVDIFNMTRDNPDALACYYKDTITRYYDDPAATYNEVRDRFNEDHNPLDFCILSRTCYSGVIRFRKKDGFMSTPKGAHKPISPETFRSRVSLWSSLIQDVDFQVASFEETMSHAGPGDLVYCDPPYTNSQTIIYGAQGFDITRLWSAIESCVERGAYVMLSINGSRKNSDVAPVIPAGLFKREYAVDCGISMIDRFQNGGDTMGDTIVKDKLLLTW